MNNLFKLVGGALIAGGLLLIPSSVQAQEITVRVEPGVAVPVTDPQSNRFNTGASLAVKPGVGLGSYFNVGPSGSILVLPSNIPGVEAGTAFGLGGFLRVKRPHDDKNTGKGFSAVSPWADLDLQYIRTGPLDRFGWAVSIGAAVPTSGSRNFWVGPFVKYQGILQEEKIGYNTNDAGMVIFGLSLELGPKQQKKVVVPPPCPPPVVVVVVNNPPPVTPKPVVPPTTVETEFKQAIQFAWDSPVLDETATSQLDEIVKKLTASKSFESIRVEGHASSEGQVEHNNVLSLKRAQSVVDFMAAHGIPKEKLSAVGFGSSVPVASNKTEAGRVLNRRDEFVVKFVVVNESK